MQRRRVFDDRASFPSQRLCTVPHLPWISLQRQNPGNRLPGTLDRWRPGAYGGRGLGVLRQGITGAEGLERRPGSGFGIPAPWAVGDGTLRGEAKGNKLATELQT